MSLLSYGLEDGGTVGTGHMTLPVLQDNIKKQPDSYKLDFLDQYAALQAQIGLFEESPQRPNKDFETLMMFVAQTAHFYGKSEELVTTLLRLIHGYITVMRAPQMRSMLAALILMDNHRHIDRTRLYKEWLPLLSIESDEIPNRVVRQIIKGLSNMRGHSDIKAWERIIFDAMKDEKKSATTYRRLQVILIHLYIKGTWKNKQTANQLANGVFHSCPKVVENSARFLLGDLKKLHVSAANRSTATAGIDEEERKQKQAEQVNSISKELSSGQKIKAKNKRKLERLKQQAERELNRLDEALESYAGIGHEILDHIYDPHRLSAQLYKRATKTGSNQLAFRTRFLLFAVISRLMNKFEVVLPGYMSHFHKYLRPSQDQITRILVILAQAVHNGIEEEELRQTTRLIADQFITEAMSSEVVAVGLNTIREMCSRNLSSITPELLSDILRISTDSSGSSVRIAVAALRNLFRQKAPHMLPKNMRGRGAELAEWANRTKNTGSNIEGFDILLKLREHALRKRNLDDSGVSQLIADAQTQRLLTSKDFALLKKIQAKMATARNMGYTMKQWLDQNEDMWEEFIGSSLPGKRGRDEDAGDITENKRRKVFGESSSTEDENDAWDDGEVISGEESGRSGDEIEDDEADVIEHSEEAHESESVSPDLEENIAKKGSDADDISTDSAVSDEEGESDADHSTFLTDGCIEVKKRLTRQQKLVIEKQNKLASRKNRKDARHGGDRKNRAGLSNRSMARNKPMAMLRQKQSVREKQTRGVRDKVTCLKKTIKTMKTQIRQKFRRQH